MGKFTGRDYYVQRLPRLRLTRLPGRDHFWQRWVLVRSQLVADRLGYDCVISYAVWTPRGYRLAHAY